MYFYFRKYAENKLLLELLDRAFKTFVAAMPIRSPKNVSTGHSVSPNHAFSIAILEPEPVKSPDGELIDEPTTSASTTSMSPWTIMLVSFI
jgi:hypothetical protein